jgi:hypothetical protein
MRSAPPCYARLLLSYLLGAIILATTINLVSGLAH